MRRLSSYIAKYGPEAGPRLYHALQSQAAHAGVSARRKRKIAAILDAPGRAAAALRRPVARPGGAGRPASAVERPRLADSENARPRCYDHIGCPLTIR